MKFKIINFVLLHFNLFLIFKKKNIFINENRLRFRNRKLNDFNSMINVSNEFTEEFSNDFKSLVNINTFVNDIESTTALLEQYNRTNIENSVGYNLVNIISKLDQVSKDKHSYLANEHKKIVYFINNIPESVDLMFKFYGLKEKYDQILNNLYLQYKFRDIVYVQSLFKKDIEDIKLKKIELKDHIKNLYNYYLSYADIIAKTKKDEISKILNILEIQNIKIISNNLMISLQYLDEINIVIPKIRAIESEFRNMRELLIKKLSDLYNNSHILNTKNSNNDEVFNVNNKFEIINKILLLITIIILI